MLKIPKIKQNTKLVCKNKIKWHRMGFKKKKKTGNGIFKTGNGILKKNRLGNGIRPPPPSGPSINCGRLTTITHNKVTEVWAHLVHCKLF